MTIDWERILAETRRIDFLRDTPMKTFSADQIAAAVAAANALPGNGDDVDTPWKRPKKMPGIDAVDFRDIVKKPVPLAGLLASNKKLSRTRLIWHIQNPGKAKNPSTFTTAPMILTRKGDQIIIDGHHRLAAVQLLGAKSWPSWLLPSK